MAKLTARGTTSVLLERITLAPMGDPGVQYRSTYGLRSDNTILVKRDWRYTNREDGRWHGTGWKVYSKRANLERAEANLLANGYYRL